MALALPQNHTGRVCTYLIAEKARRSCSCCDGGDGAVVVDDDRGHVRVTLISNGCSMGQRRTEYRDS